jgi:hypothetical protein
MIGFSLRDVRTHLPLVLRNSALLIQLDFLKQTAEHQTRLFRGELSYGEAVTGPIEGIMAAR